jgi:hypothetical protein
MALTAAPSASPEVVAGVTGSGERVHEVESLAGTVTPAVGKIVHRVKLIAAYTAASGAVDPNLASTAVALTGAQAAVPVAIELRVASSESVALDALEQRHPSILVEVEVSSGRLHHAVGVVNIVAVDASIPVHVEGEDSVLAFVVAAVSVHIDDVSTPIVVRAVPTTTATTTPPLIVAFQVRVADVALVSGTVVGEVRARVPDAGSAVIV